MPIDPAFASGCDQAAARTRLKLELDVPMVLVLLGGRGFGKPHLILKSLQEVRAPLQVVFITGKDPRVEEQVRRLCAGRLRHTALGWVDNMHEWMCAADLLVAKAGGGSVLEGLAAGLPILAFASLPGSEERTSAWIEREGLGWWIRRPEEIGPIVERLLNDPAELANLRAKAKSRGRPRAAFEAAEAILRLAHSGAPADTAHSS
jgi:processive 1,2-diacylglycerol beta-glucosyltransferase